MKIKLLAALLIFTNIIWANTDVAPPANDDFANAIPISCGQNYTASTVEATLDEDNAPDGFGADLDAPNIWYSYTGSGVAKVVTLDLCASGYDTAYLVYTGTPGNLTLVAANEDNTTQCGAGFRSYGTFESDGTTTYYITITGYGPTDVGTVDLTVSCGPVGAVVIPDANFEQALIDLGHDSGVVDGYLFTAAVDQVTDLNISNKNISDLTGIEFFTSLQTLNCSNNNLTSLGLNVNTNLTHLECNDNAQLTKLNVKNGNNTNFTTFSATGNTNLTCIQVDDVTYSTSNWTTIDAGVSFATFCEPSTYVPDDNFEQALIDLGYDDVLDDYVVTANINTVEVLSIPSRNISDLTGIEAFTALTSLNANSNQLTAINVTQNLALTYLNLMFNSLEAIDISQNVLLEYLDCGTSNLTEINVTNNIALKSLIVYSNQLTNLDVSQNSALEILSCFSNNLTSIDVSQNLVLKRLSVGYNNLDTINVVQNTLLELLSCSNSNLTEIDVTNNTALESINLNNNLLTSLDFLQNLALEELFVINNSQLTTIALPVDVGLKRLGISGTQLTNINFSQIPMLEDLYAINSGLTSIDVSANPALKELYCSQNSLMSLDVSVNTQLITLDCHANALTSLNVKNGNNTNFTTFSATGNGNLACVQVDDVAYSTTNWTNVDAGVNFSQSCNATTYVPDDNFEQALIDLGYDDILNDYVLTENINTVDVLDVSNKSISDLTGIEDFTALTSLNISLNNLTSLNLTQNIALTYLDSQLTPLNTIDISQNVLLDFLRLTHTTITTIDVTNNIALKLLIIPNNDQLINLDISQNLALEELTVQSCNQLSNIEFPVGGVLHWLNMSYTEQLTNIDFSQIPTLRSLHATDCGLTSIDVSANSALVQLFLGENLLTNIDVSANPALIGFYSENMSSLVELNIQNGNNTNFTFFNITGNPNLACVQVDDVAYSTTNWTNVDAGVNFSVNCVDLINDDFADAIPVSSGQNYTSSTAEATLDEDNAPDSVSPVVDLDAPNIWYSYTGSGIAEVVTLDLCASGYDTSYLVYTGTSGNLTLVAANDDNEAECGTGFRSYGTFESDGTTTYYITITGYNVISVGAVDLTVSSVPVPPGEIPIPDANFEQALIDLGIDSGVINGSISPVGLDQVNDLDVSNKNISDLTGIEAFTSLSILNCSNNNLTTINVTNNTALESINLNNNLLTSLDFLQNVALEELFVIDNSQLSTIALPVNVGLKRLGISSTQLTNINFSQLPILEELYAADCGLTSIDVSANLMLKKLNVSQNLLTSLDVFANTQLIEFDCHANALTSLNVKNGNNTNFTVFNALGNVDLTCIKVDDAVYSTTNWTDIEPTTYFSETCTENLNYLVLEDISVYRNVNQSFEVSLETNEIIRGIQFDITLPDGFTFDPANLEASTSLSAFQVNVSSLGLNIYRVIVFSLSSQLPADAEVIFTFPITVSNTTAAANYLAPITNVILSDINNQDIATTPATIGSITVLSNPLGDANNDNTVNVIDILQQIDFIFGSNPMPFIFDLADVDGNDEINILDVVGTQDIILNPSPTLIPTVIPESTFGGNNYMYAQNATVTPGMSHNLELAMYNDNTIRAIQFDVTLPAGFNYTPGTATAINSLAGFTVSNSSVGPNAYRFIILSFTGATLPANEESILNLPITIDAGVMDGMYQITYSDVILSNTANIDVATAATQIGTLTINTLGIADVAISEGFSFYPNPVKSIFTIQNAANTFIESVRVYNITGALIKEMNVKNSPEQLELNMENTASGVYILKINTAKGELVKRILKE